MKQLLARDHATVLVVEDDFLIRLSLVDMLEEAGFRVYEAVDADCAIGALEQRQDIDAIFTDIDMPGSMDGLELARRVRCRWPDVGVIVTSGGARRGNLDLPDGGVFIPKPYSVDRVVDKLNTLLEHQHSTH